VSSDHDEPIDDQDELYEDVPPRSIFAATWFRVVLVVIVLGVVGAVAVPYVLDWMNPPPAPRTVATTRSPLTPTAAPLTPAAPSPADKPASDKPLGDKVVTDKKESSTIIPAPAASSPAPAPAPTRPEPKSEAKATSPAPAAKSTPEPVAKASAPEPKAEAKTQTAMAVTESPKSPMTKPSLRPETTSKDDSTAATGKAATTKSAAAKATTPTAVVSGNGLYWVQIGAFKDADTAKRLAAKLREENFKAEESVKRVGGASAAATPAPAPKAATPAPSSSDQYDVFVSGMGTDELNRRLAGKGLSAESAGGGAVVKPSLPLRDAVALSKDLAVDGFKVQVRRSGAAASAPSIVSQPSPTPAAITEGGLSLHRVRFGAFTDRAAAMAAARELENKGFKPFIARGDQ
jgi:DedD protein